MADVLSRVDTTVGAGAFNRRITIQQQVINAPDGMGGSTAAWTTACTTWAHIEAWKGSESFTAQQIYPSMLTKMLIRYRPSQNISAAMRVLYGSRIYNIRSVSVPAEAQTTIQLVCEELQAKGSKN